MDNQMAVVLANTIETLQRNFKSVVHDAANSATPGFKRTINLMSEARSKSLSGQTDISFVKDSGTKKDMSDGPLITTGDSMHIALRGKGALGISIKGKIFYTRKGILETDASGRLVDENGNPYTDQGGGSISIPLGTKKLEISHDGTILADGNNIGKLGLFEFPQKAKINTINGGYFSSTLPATISKETKIIQGAYEGSNVKREALMIDMIQIQHEIQMATQAMKQMKETYQQTTESLLIAPSAQ